MPKIKTITVGLFTLLGVIFFINQSFGAPKKKSDKEKLAFYFEKDHWGETRFEMMRSEEYKVLKEKASKRKSEMHKEHKEALKDPIESKKKKRDALVERLQKEEPRVRAAMMRFAGDRGAFKEGEIEGNARDEYKITKPVHKMSRTFTFKKSDWPVIAEAMDAVLSDEKLMKDKKYKKHKALLKEYLKFKKMK